MKGIFASPAKRFTEPVNAHFVRAVIMLFDACLYLRNQSNYPAYFCICHRLWLDDRATYHGWWKNAAAILENGRTPAFRRQWVLHKKDDSSSYDFSLHSTETQLISIILKIIFSFCASCKKVIKFIMSDRGSKITIQNMLNTHIQTMLIT